MPRARLHINCRAFPKAEVLENAGVPQCGHRSASMATVPPHSLQLIVDMAASLKKGKFNAANGIV